MAVPALAASVPDTPDSRLAIQVDSDDAGPLFLALLMGNNNLNAAAQIGASHPQLVPDTLDMRQALQAVKNDQGYAKSVPEAANKQPIPDLLNSGLAVQELMAPPPLANPVLKLRGRSSESHPAKLNEKQLRLWRDEGYLVIPDALSKHDVAELLRCVHESADILATADDKRVKPHAYNVGQDNYISAVGRVLMVPSKMASQPGAEPLQLIQRLGCGIHRVMPTFREAIMSQTHADMVKALGYTDPRVVQSLIIVKAAQVGAKVQPHQDGCSGFTDPPSCTMFWYAVEDATTENGCLAVAPGSHRTQPLTRRCRQDKSGLPEFVDLKHPVYACIEGISADAAVPERDEHGDLVYKQLEVKAGTLILMHGNLMHASEANRSGKNRVAFNFGVVEGTHEWLADNYLQPYDGETEFEKLQAC